MTSTLMSFLSTKSRLNGQYDLAQSQNLLVQFMERYKADKDWYLTMLATFEPAHEVFSQSYRFEQVRAGPFAFAYDNADGLFDGEHRGSKGRGPFSRRCPAGAPELAPVA